MEFIANWFPFTLEEARGAFLAQGLAAADADVAAANLAEEFALLDESEGFGFAEIGDDGWLAAIAATSEDAARRVAEFRQRWGPPQPGIWEVVVHGED